MHVGQAPVNFICQENTSCNAELVPKPVPREQQRIETRTAVKRTGSFAIVATAVAVLAVVGAVVLFAQGQDKDKYSLVSPGGIAFSDFTGYERTGLTSPPREPPKYSR